MEQAAKWGSSLVVRIPANGVRYSLDMHHGLIVDEPLPIANLFLPAYAASLN